MIYRTGNTAFQCLELRMSSKEQIQTEPAAALTCEKRLAKSIRLNIYMERWPAMIDKMKAIY